MKVFVIKGSIKGMVKIDNKLHLSGENIDSVDKVILACGQDIKVISRAELNENITFSPKDLLLLDSSDNVIGYGSEQGRPNVNDIMIRYKKTIVLNNNFASKNDEVKIVNVVKEQPVEDKKTDSCTTDLVVEEDEEICENTPKIAPKIKNEKVFNINSCDLGNNKLDVPSDIVDTQVNEFVDSILDTANKQINCNESDITSCGELDHIILGRDEDISGGVDFIMQNFDEKKVQTNNYYNDIKNDLEKFFKSHKKNEELEAKVWGSRWVSINADYNYSVGVIFEDNIPSIIAYAIPYSDFNQIDMDNLKFGEWLQISDKPNENRGYFVYYQNAQTGEMILNSNN